MTHKRFLPCVLLMKYGLHIFNVLHCCCVSHTPHSSRINQSSTPTWKRTRYEASNYVIFSNLQMPTPFVQCAPSAASAQTASFLWRTGVWFKWNTWQPNCAVCYKATPQEACLHANKWHPNPLEQKRHTQRKCVALRGDLLGRRIIHSFSHITHKQCLNWRHIVSQTKEESLNSFSSARKKEIK